MTLAAVHEGIGNSFAVAHDGVYIATNAALYRLAAGRHSTPRVLWRRRYANVGTIKPGQTQPGFGTTPTLMGERYVAITDNADPMRVVVARRRDGRVVCRAPVFGKGASATDQSLIVTDHIIVAENNFAYSSRRARLHLHQAGPCSDGRDAWYLTALDARTGATVFKRLGGAGVAFNNNYAPITLGPNGTAYLGVLGGIVAWRDRAPTNVAHGHGVEVSTAS